MAQRREQVFVEALLAHLPVEAFDQTVLHGFAQCEGMPTDFAVFVPRQHRVAGSLRPVVGNHHTGIAAQFSDTIQRAGDTRTAD